MTIVAGKNTKAAAILEMMNKGKTNKEIRTRMKVSPSYLWKLRSQMAHKTEEPEDVKEALHQITRGRQARQADATNVDKILDKRAEQYGSFMQSSDTAVKIKGAIHNALARNDTHMFPDQMIALDMIALKISRIANGNAAHLDSWLDIAGYAKLVADRLQGKVR
jgi:hypothetical protein